jgi:Icc-related predicted phosphoesterase
MLGNDDPAELRDLLDAAPWGIQDEGKTLWIDDEHEMISWGYSNITPWHTYREQSEEELAASIEAIAKDVTRPERAVFNLHVPPYGTQLDDAPLLDANLQVQAVLGQVQYVAVGSTAVREIELRRQPLLGLHGHIHESSGVRRLGRTMVINPGSDYSTGALNGVLVTLDRDKISAHQMVRG